MEPDEINENLWHIGKRQYALHYHTLTDKALTSAEKRVALVQAGVDANSARIMVGYVTPIIDAGAEQEALRIVWKSPRVKLDGREQARVLLNELDAAK